MREPPCAPLWRSASLSHAYIIVKVPQLSPFTLEVQAPTHRSFQISNRGWGAVVTNMNHLNISERTWLRFGEDGMIKNDKFKVINGGRKTRLIKDDSKNRIDGIAYMHDTLVSNRFKIEGENMPVIIHQN